jgi:hypothetical protein
LTTKIHLAADPHCRPLVLLISPGQSGDAPHFPLLIDALRVPRPVGRPPTRPEAVLADKAYSSKAIRAHLRRRGIRAIIPQPADQIAHRKRRGRHGGTNSDDPHPTAPTASSAAVVRSTAGRRRRPEMAVLDMNGSLR